MPPFFLSEVLGCQESRQGTTRRLAAATPGLGRWGSWPWLSAAGTAAVGSCWSGRDNPEAGLVDSEVWTEEEGLVYSFASQQNPHHPGHPHLKTHSKGMG